MENSCFRCTPRINYPIKMLASDLINFGVLLSLLMFQLASSSTVQLQAHNIDDILNHNELVLVNFYADWCRFSSMLKPIYDDTARKVAEEYPEPGKVTLGAVDCDRETAIAQKYQVTKYPTLKLFRYGQQIKREFRGQRSVEAMTNFIRDQLKDPVVRVDNLDVLDELDTSKRHLIGYFSSDDGADYKTFLKVGSMLRDDCKIYAVIGEAADSERVSGNKLVFRPAGDLATDMLYTGPLTDYNILLMWATDKCVPLVREITFENAEELTEEGLPFMILFHHIDDTETPEKFKKMVAQELLGEKNSINFLTANGEKFSHPLYHLGKTVKDLPVLAIDSFRHMYLWNHNPKTDIDTPGLLKQFVLDLHSGKLHREFHHGPDPTTKAAETPNGDNGSDENKAGALAIGHHEDHEKTVHFNVEQQIIVHANGMRMQVVRFIQVGKQRPVDLRHQLSAISMNDIGHSDGDHHEDKKQPDSLLDKVISQFFGGDGGDEDDDENDENDNNMDGVGEGVAKEADTENEQESEGLETESRGRSRTFHDEEAFKQWESLHGSHHGGHHHGHRAPSSATTTVSYTKVTKLKMKINDERFKEDENAPPSSIFRKLAPSRERYTILRDEL